MALWATQRLLRLLFLYYTVAFCLLLSLSRLYVLSNVETCMLRYITVIIWLSRHLSARKHFVLSDMLEATKIGSTRIRVSLRGKSVMAWVRASLKRHVVIESLQLQWSCHCGSNPGSDRPIRASMLTPTM